MHAKLLHCYEELERHREWFLSLSRERPSLLSKPLGKDEWSLGEVIEHLVIVEGNILPTIEKASKECPPQSFFKRLRWAIVQFILSHGIKVPVPSERALPKGALSIEENLQRWETLRHMMKDVLQKKSGEDIGKFAFHHPRAGDLNVLETLEFLSVHLRYHIVRTSKLLASNQ